MSLKEVSSYVCGEAFAWGDHVYVPGKFYAADDPGVIANPQWFAPYGTPDDQLPRPGWAALDSSRHGRAMERQREERQAFEAEAELNPVRLELDDAVVLKKDIFVRFAGRPCKLLKGSRALATDPVVVGNPGDHWKSA